MRLPENPDFLLREADAVYRERAKVHLTSHQLGDFRKCPKLHDLKKLGLIPDEDRPAYPLGRAIHALALEGRPAFEARFAVGGPINPKTGRPFGSTAAAYGEWAAEQAAQGRECVTEEQYTLADRMAQAVKAHPIARELLAEGIPEGVIRTEYGGMACQGRIDWFHPLRGIVDLKTCDDLGWFEADAKRYGYAHQLAFYRSLVQRVTATLYPVHLIGVEKKQPFRCGVWEVSEQTLAHCQRENEAAMARLIECNAAECFPTGYEELRVFDAI